MTTCLTGINSLSLSAPEATVLPEFNQAVRRIKANPHRSSNGRHRTPTFPRICFTASQGAKSIFLAMDPATPTPNPPQPKPRVRSDAQLNRKRLTDRIKQKENRNENKQRLEKIESSIVSIQDRLESLVVQLQNNTPLALSVPTASIHSPQVVSDQSLPALHSTYGSHTPQPLLANSSSLPWSGQGHHTPPQAPPDTGTGITKIWGYTPSQHRPSSRILNCRCGLQHPDHFDCLETCNVTTLYRRHLGVAGTESASPFPRNPSLACMMLHQGDESILTFFITGYLQQCRTKSIEQLLAFYFLAYRYMRVSGT